jgi:hypothetical protein
MHTDKTSVGPAERTWRVHYAVLESQTETVLCRDGPTSVTRTVTVEYLTDWMTIDEANALRTEIIQRPGVQWAWIN